MRHGPAIHWMLLGALLGACTSERRPDSGSAVQWFEDRGPKCTLLVYVDDATSRLMELRFVASESAFDDFASTRAYAAASMSARTAGSRPVTPGAGSPSKSC